MTPRVAAQKCRRQLDLSVENLYKPSSIFGSREALLYELSISAALALVWRPHCHNSI